VTVLDLVNAVRRGGGEIALSSDGCSVIGRNIPKPLHHHLKNTTNRDLVLHWFRVSGMRGREQWRPLVEAAAAAELEIRRYVTSPWTGGLITTDEYLETYTTGERPPS